ncbi:glycosyltransferase [Rubellimicrobium roseum]|uniref:glycosyltransferase n=1 Tax=Rubellimicrobium roseum TaxID=687525 RepID=UPI00159BA12A|nr:glycosyltransferase [Rubellimicrobium roseum]
MDGVTIIVCCYNSEQRIERTIRHLLGQQIRSVPGWEIVLVDNKSTDRTVELVRAIWSREAEPPPLRVVHEERPGLSHARKAGVQAASHSCIVFCDDDNWLDADYVETAYQIMSRDPQIGVLGGAITPVGDAPFPPWFLTNCACFAVGAQGRVSGDISARGYVWGAGAVVRRDLLLTLYETCGGGLLVGREGSKQGSGDDSEISKWYLLAGRKLYYSEQLILSHYMPASRVRKEVLERLLNEGASATSYLNLYDAILMVLEPARFASVSVPRRLLTLARGARGLLSMTRADFRRFRRLIRCCRQARLA